jgi:ATP-dependent Clp protease ATP-binding subunit ClpA
MEKAGEDDRAVKEFFKPELRNRLDGIVKFKKLEQLSIKKIVNKFVNELKKNLKRKKINITMTEPAVDFLAEQGYDRKMGARPLARKIDELIKVPLSEKILFEKLEGVDVTISVNNNEIEFSCKDCDKKALPKVSTDGLIVLDQFKPKN